MQPRLNLGHLKAHLTNGHYPAKLDLSQNKTKRCKLCYLKRKNPNCAKTSYNAHDIAMSLRETFFFVSFALANFIQTKDCI